MPPITLRFALERETKGTHRYQAVTVDGTPDPYAAVETFYLRKTALGPTPPPRVLEVTFKPAV